MNMRVIFQKCIVLGVLLVLICSSQVLYAQQVVKGKVLDAELKQPMIGVAVKVKGGTAITQTDSDGNFQLNVTAGATLEFSYVGYIKKEAAASGGAMQVILDPDNTQLGEVRSEEHTV